MKLKTLRAWIVGLATLFVVPSLVLAHGDEDHGKDFHIEVMHVMESGFHGKIDGKVTEVVLAPDAEIKKEGKAITVSDLAVGDMVLVKGTKMPGNKIGGSKVTVDKAAPMDHSNHDDHKMKGHKGMMGMESDHSGHDHGDH